MGGLPGWLVLVVFLGAPAVVLAIMAAVDRRVFRRRRRARQEAARHTEPGVVTVVRSTGDWDL